jgi:HK97 family phage portal protein
MERAVAESRMLSLLADVIAPRQKSLNAVPASRGWWPLVREGFAGAWQRNITVQPGEVLAFHAVFACMTLVASDIAKLRVKLMARDANGIWTETTSPSFSPVLRKPNGYQNRIQFYENWMLSKLSRGNTYILKQRDARGIVTALYVLDPNRVQPLVSDGGEVFYQLHADYLSDLPDAVIVPAREIIHDRFNCLFHPLVGISPIYASGLAATQGLKIQNNSATFFANGSKPGGILSAPGRIEDDNARRLKEYWDENFSGDNAGKIAVLGDGLEYKGLSVDPVDAQLIEQLKWTSEVVCSTFHVPPYKIGIGQMPTYNNIQALNVEYYSQCLQAHIEAAELCLDEGLGIGDGVPIAGSGATYGTEFDVDNLLRMDAVSQMEVLDKAKNTMTPNEARKKLDLVAVKGGDSVYRQQQDFSLEALAKRDAQADPFASKAPTAPAAEPAAPPPTEAGNDNEMELQATKAVMAMMKGLA